MTTLEFLSALFGSAESGYIYLWTTPDKLSQWFPVTNLTTVSQAAERLSGARKNVYYGLGLTAVPKRPDERAMIDEVTTIPGLWVELDLRDATHPNNPTDIAELLALVQAWPLPPSIIVSSGHGLHAYWLFREPWDITDDRTRAADMLKRFISSFRAMPAAAAWKIDSVFDLARVLRLPGTTNYKSAPVPVEVISAGPERYNPDDFEQFLPDVVPAVPTTAGERRTSGFERRPSDGPVKYMLQNCMFMQHWQLDYKTMTEPEWVAAIANAIRGVGGEEFIIEITRNWLGEKFDYDKTIKKIQHIIEDFKGPHSCEMIRSMGFQGCPAGGCGMQAPCGWSLGRVPQARAMVKAETILSPETVYKPEFMQAAAILEKEDPIQYDILWQRLTGQVNKNTFKKELAKFKREQSGLTVIDGGAKEDLPELSSDGAIWLKSVIPDIPLNLRVPGSQSSAAWVVRRSGISLKRVTNFGESYQLASYVPVIIAERIFNIDTQQEKAVVVFRGPRGNWRSATLPKSTIFDARRIMCLSDAMLTINSEMAKILTKWLTALEAANMDVIPLSQGVGKMGWRNHEQVFILPGITSDYKIDIGEAAAESAVAGLGQAGDFSVWLDAMRKLRTRTKARFIMAASFAAPLLKIVGQRSFLIHNWDTTRGGKSATLMAALSIWGNPEELSKSFEDSKTNTERTAALFTDLPLGINEYEILNEKQKGEVESKIYQISEGKGKGRATREGLQTTVRWRTIALMTGETQITRHNTRGGVFTRLIEIKGGPLADDDIFASSLYPLTARHYGHAGKLFVEQLLQTNHDWLRDVYHKTRIALREKYPNKIESHMDAIACIVVAEFLASYWIFGIPEEQAKAEAIRMAEEIIQEIITKAEASEAERAWEWLPDWLAANEARFQNGYADRKTSMACLGYVDGDNFYIIKSELEKALREEGFNAAKTLQAWADKELFPCTVDHAGWRRLGIRHTTDIGNSRRPFVIKIKK